MNYQKQIEMDYRTATYGNPFITSGSLSWDRLMLPHLHWETKINNGSWKHFWHLLLSCWLFTYSTCLSQLWEIHLVRDLLLQSRLDWETASTLSWLIGIYVLKPSLRTREENWNISLQLSLSKMETMRIDSKKKSWKKTQTFSAKLKTTDKTLSSITMSSKVKSKTCHTSWTTVSNL